MKDKYNKLIEQFTTNATKHGEETLKGNHIKANYYIKKNIRILKQMEKDNTIEEFLEDLMGSPNIFVQCSSAIEFLRHNTSNERAINILKNVINTKNEKYKIVVFNAEWFLNKVLPNL